MTNVSIVKRLPPVDRYQANPVGGARPSGRRLPLVQQADTFLKTDQSLSEQVRLQPLIAGVSSSASCSDWTAARTASVGMTATPTETISCARRKRSAAWTGRLRSSRTTPARSRFGGSDHNGWPRQSSSFRKVVSSSTGTFWMKKAIPSGARFGAAILGQRFSSSIWGRLGLVRKVETRGQPYSNPRRRAEIERERSD